MRVSTFIQKSHSNFRWPQRPTRHQAAEHFDVVVVIKGGVASRILILAGVLMLTLRPFCLNRRSLQLPCEEAAGWDLEPICPLCSRGKPPVSGWNQTSIRCSVGGLNTLRTGLL
jgi:hypothetical protein